MAVLTDLYAEALPSTLEELILTADIIGSAFSPPIIIEELGRDESSFLRFVLPRPSSPLDEARIPLQPSGFRPQSPFITSNASNRLPTPAKATRLELDWRASSQDDRVA